MKNDSVPLGVILIVVDMCILLLLLWTAWSLDVVGLAEESGINNKSVPLLIASAGLWTVVRSNNLNFLHSPLI